MGVILFDGRVVGSQDVVTAGRGAGVAVLDQFGVVVAVNEAWDAMGDRVRGLPGPAVGAPFLGGGAEPDDVAWGELRAAVAHAVAGDVPLPVLVVVRSEDVGGPGPVGVVVSSRWGDAGECVGATVVVVPVTGAPDARQGPGTPLDRQADAPGRSGSGADLVSADGPSDPLLRAAGGLEGLLERLALTGEGVPDGWLVVDAQGRIVAVNGRLEVLTGYPAGRLLGEPVEVLFSPQVWERLVGLRAEPRPRRLGEGGVVQLWRADGSLVAVDVQLTPVAVDGTALTAVRVRDISAGQASDDMVRRQVVALDMVPDAVFVTDPSTRIRYVNQAACHLLGYGATELVGMPAGQLRPDLPEEDRRAAIVKLVADPETERHLTEVRLVAKDGQVIDSFGTVFINVVRDVREHSRLVRRLQAAQASFRTLFEQAPVGALVVKVQGDGGRVILLANAAVAGIFDSSVDSIVGGDLSRFLTTDAAPPFVADIVSVADHALPHASAVLRFRRPDGTQVCADARVVPIEVPTLGDRLVLVYLVDVTERQEALERLKVSEAAFRTMFERAPIGTEVLSVEPDGTRRIVMANQALADMFREPIDALVGAAAEAFIVREELGEEPLTTRLGGRPGETVSATRQYRRRDGSRLWVEACVTTIDLPETRDSAGWLALVHAMDVTDRYRQRRARARRAAASDVIAAVATAVLGGRPIGAVYQQVVDGLARVFGAENVTLRMPDPWTGGFPVAAGLGPLGSELAVAADPGTPELQQWLAEHRPCVKVVVPESVPGKSPERLPLLGPCVSAGFLAGQDGTGVICLSRPRGAEAFDAEDLDLLDMMTRQLALAIDLGRIREQQWAQLVAREEYLARLETAIKPLPDAQQIYRAACRFLRDHLGAGAVEYLEIASGHGAEEDLGQPSGGAAVLDPVTDGDTAGSVVLIGEVARDYLWRGEPLVVDDVTEDPRFGAVERQARMEAGAVASIGMSLLKSGRLIAALRVRSPAPRHWTPLEVKLVQDTAERTWSAVERALAEHTAAAQQALRQAAERQLVEQAARDRREHLEQNFITNAAHELRTPLTGILVAVAALRAGAMDDPADRDVFLGYLDRDAGRLARLSNGLLALAQAQSLDMPPPRRPLVVRQLLDQVASGLDLAAAVTLSVRADPDLRMEANADLAQVLIGNLAANAARFTVTGDVVLSAREAPGFVVVEIRDTGPGMAPDVLRRAQDRFYRADAARSDGGFGLGLSIAGQAAAAMGAHLGLRSVLGEGTIAQVDFPLGDSPAASPAEPG